MDTSRFQHKDCRFQFLNFFAFVEWRSESAISFRVGRYHRDDKGIFLRYLGWLDVVHPCHGHIKTRVRTDFGAELDFEQKLEMIRSVFSALCIPEDETYEIDFLTVTANCPIHQPVDRNGYTDRT